MLILNKENGGELLGGSTYSKKQLIRAESKWFVFTMLQLDLKNISLSIACF